MRDELHRYLDGELDREELPERLREDAGVWDRFLGSLRSEAVGSAPARVESEVMRTVRQEGGEGWWERAWDWLVRPRSVRISPVAGAALAALLAVAWLRPWAGPETGGSDVALERTATTQRPAGLRSDASTQLVSVQFSLRAPSASMVQVAGDFSDWQPVTHLQDPDGDGVWTGRATLRAGVHEYMFVVDGTRWVTDPGAERYADDGFGNRNAVLAVSTGGGG